MDRKHRAAPGPQASSGRRAAHSRIVQDNIQAIATLEHAALADRSTAARLSDAVAGFAGSTTFVLFHVLWFGGWILLNSGRIGGIHPFDAYPFTFLTFIVSLEAIFLSTFVLRSQNRMSRQADQRAHLELQVNLLAEQEATRTLALLHRLCEHFGLEPEANDPETRDLMEATRPDELANQLRQHLPPG
jgi:uncharacterized membrane protein